MTVVFDAVALLATVTFGSNLKTIGTYAFKGCAAFGDITIPGHIRQLGSSIFSGCDNVRNFTFEASDEAIEFISGNPMGGRALESLTLDRIVPGISGTVAKHITMGEVWEKVPDQFFSGMSELISVSLPSTLQTIEERVFNGCKNIESVVSLAKIPPVCGNEAFDSEIYPKAVLTVPMGSRRKYVAPKHSRGGWCPDHGA